MSPRNSDDEETPQEQRGGFSRRDALRRGAILGGALVWATPVVQGLGTPAFAQMGQSPGAHACCYCYNGSAPPAAASPVNPGTGVASECSADSFTDPERLNRDSCQTFCEDLGYEHYQYVSSPNPTACSTNPLAGFVGCVTFP
jgi:hypothetical protein